MHRIHMLMRLLTNLNAGAMLALCLWLSSAALDYTARQTEAGRVMPAADCSCRLTTMPEGAAPLRIAAMNL